MPVSILRDCPACGARNGSEIARHEVWRLVECTQCGLVYMPAIPPDEIIEEEYDWEASFRRERLSRWLASPLARFWTGLFLWLKPNRQARALRQIRRTAPLNGRFLDIGAGDGRLAALAQRKGYDVTCVELSPRMAAKAASRVGSERVLVGRLEDFSLPPFDLIVAISVLEHIPEPRRVLEHVFRLLAPGGVIVIKVPNFDSRLRTLRGKRWSGYRWPEHVQYFTPATLRPLVVASGLEVMRIDANPWSDNFWLAARRPANGQEERDTPGAMPR